AFLRCAGLRVSEVLVAPAIGAPSAYHCTAVATFAGSQVPTSAVSVDPTTGEPLSAGGEVFVIAWSLKWMKPLGQRLEALVMRRQLKSPPQLSSEMMISVAETTCST